MAYQQETADLERFHAGWKVQQPDGIGSIYYFYPDRTLVIQNPRRREFVQVGKWMVEGKKELVLFDIAPRNTSLSEDELKECRARRRVYSVVFESNTEILLSLENSTDVLTLHRVSELPDRDEKRYWGFRYWQNRFQG